MKQSIVKILEKALKKLKVKLKKEEIEALISIPPTPEMGDYAFPCFLIAEKLKLSPHEAALELREKIGTESPTEFDSIETEGAYVNFLLDRKNLARKIVWEAITKKSEYGKSKIGRGRKVVVEFSSINVAKPFGIGHLRSTILGNSIAKILEFQGFKPVRINYLGDWGAQFGKMILGFIKFGSESKLEKNPVKHMLDIYVKANKKTYEKESREWFKKLEDGDKKAVMLWRVFKDLSMEDFEKIYKTLGIKFDSFSGEYDTLKTIPRVLKELEKKKLLKKSQGALIVDLTKYNLGVFLIQKSDGTTLYGTRDLAAAIKRYEKYKFESMVYQVGQEQTFYFKQLFKVLELMGYKWAKNCLHSEHGLYLDKDGKKFATRKGKTIFMEEIIDKTTKLAKKEIKKRVSRIAKDDLEARALKIALAAIFYGDLKSNKKSNIIFDLNKFVSFEGDTGPYILYSYARASSIMRKTTAPKKFEILDLEDKELELVKKLLQFEEVALNAYKTLNPSVIANYSYQLSKIFNEFYHACPVLGSESEAFRLALVEAFRQVLKNSLNLLGINTVEEM